MKGTEVWCWGLNDVGQQGRLIALGYVPGAAQGPGGLGTFTGAATLVAGAKHTCAAKADGSVWCWGLNNPNGQLGNNATTNSTYPVQVVGPGGVGTFSGATFVGATSQSTCAAKTDDALWCWGLNTSGQLGDATTTPSTVPVNAL